MTKYCIETSYNAYPSATVTFPEGKTWEDVKNWYVKWDTLNVLFKGDEDYIEIDLNSEALDCIDWKRPRSVTVMGYTEDGCIDYDNIVAETE